MCSCLVYGYDGSKCHTDNCLFCSCDVSDYNYQKQESLCVSKSSSALPLVPHSSQISYSLLQDIFLIQIMLMMMILSVT